MGFGRRRVRHAGHRGRGRARRLGHLVPEHDHRGRHDRPRDDTTDLETTDLETTEVETTDLDGIDSETTALFGTDVVDAPPAWDTWTPTSDATFDAVELVDAGTVEEAFVAPDDELSADEPAADEDTPQDAAPEDSSAAIAHISWRADDSHDEDTVEDAVDVDTINAADIVANADWIIDTPTPMSTPRCPNPKRSPSTSISSSPVPTGSSATHSHWWRCAVRVDS